MKFLDPVIPGPQNRSGSIAELLLEKLAMVNCPHCQQPIPDPPKSGGGAGPILLWGGLGVLLGVVGSCLIGIVAMAAIASIGTSANKTFGTVGTSLGPSRR